MNIQEGQLLWTPSRERVESSACFRFMNWLNANKGKNFATYDDLWCWSTTDTAAYWAALWEYMGIEYDGHIEQVCDTLEMRPGVTWFKGARINFAEYLLKRAQGVDQAILHLSETQPLAGISGEELARRVRVMATALRARGVKPGDRVCALMPVIPETVVAMLASISIGATWSNAAPEFGPQSIIDRFGQVAPKVLFVTDGYRYGGKDHDRRAVVADVLGRLPSVETVVWLPNVDANAQCPAPSVPYASLVEGPDPGADAFRYERVPADHPLWIVFSSGTSGLPKAIVHSHAGGLLGMYTFCHFHMDVQAGDRVFFYTTTGWIMFNFMVCLLMTGATSVLYDGDPMYPRPTRIWELAQETRATEIGASPTYIEMLRSSGIEPGKLFDVSHLRSLCMSGAPCQPDTMAWCYQGIKQDLWVNNCSGGTEIASALVGGSPMLPVYAGEIQGRCLGFAVEAHDESGKPVMGEVGELVCTRPWPSMPVYFLNDPGHRRYNETYFEHEPGVWWHGDMLKINERGGCYIYGRADSTLNRRGIRIGTAEIYRVVDSTEGIADSLVVSMNEGGTSDVMTLFVQLKPGCQLDDTLRATLRTALKTRYSPRHAPDRIEQVPAIPYTLTGKKMEIPVRRILSGVPPEKAASRDAMRDPAALDYFIARAQAGRRTQA